MIYFYVSVRGYGWLSPVQIKEPHNVIVTSFSKVLLCIFNILFWVVHLQQLYMEIGDPFIYSVIT
jgi:hypothetical protein